MAIVPVTYPTIKGSAIKEVAIKGAAIKVARWRQRRFTVVVSGKIVQIGRRCILPSFRQIFPFEI
jgi:hypothetical protein